jgi:hypothetical protein
MNTGIFDVAPTTAIASSLLGSSAISASVATILPLTLNNEPLTLEFDTTVGTVGSRQVCISLAGTVNVLVDWGDRYVESFTTIGDKLHTYVNNGVYIVRIYGSLTAFGSSTTTIGKDKLTRCLAWGNLRYTTYDNFFYNNTNLRSVPPIAPPTSIASAASMFQAASVFNQPLNNWNMSLCTNTSNMFAFATAFNSSLAGWNLSNNTNMASMFQQATAFNQPINDWTLNTTSNFTTVSMFESATAFNQPLNLWNMNRCTNAQRMMLSASSFNSSLAGWNLSSCTNFTFMLSTTPFNQPINDWTLSTTSYFITTQMFFLSSAFNQPLNNWNMSRCTHAGSMFSSASSFNSSLAGWNLSACNNLNSMFSSTSFNQPINDWTMPTVGFEMQNLLIRTPFDQSLSNWNLRFCTAANNILSNNTNFTTTSYDSTLIGWNNSRIAVGSWPSNIAIGFGATKYSSASSSARAALVAYGWTITDGGIQN